MLNLIDLISPTSVSYLVRSPFSIGAVSLSQLRLLNPGSLFRSNIAIGLCSKCSLSAPRPRSVHVGSNLRRQSSSEKMTTTADVPLLIISENARSERRISPAWTIAQLKGRLESITGVPVSSQRLILRVASWPDQNLQTVDQENTQLGAFTLQSYAELHVSFNSTVPSHVSRSLVMTGISSGRAPCSPVDLRRV